MITYSILYFFINGISSLMSVINIPDLPDGVDGVINSFIDYLSTGVKFLVTYTNWSYIISLAKTALIIESAYLVFLLVRFIYRKFMMN